MGLIATHCMMQLVVCSKELCQRYVLPFFTLSRMEITPLISYRLEVETLDYAEVAQFAIVECTEKVILGKIAR